MAPWTRASMLAALCLCLCGIRVSSGGATASDIISETRQEDDGGRRRLTAIGDTPWSTKGNKIIDNNGNEVYFSGVNWNGFESAACVADGLSEPSLSLQDHLSKMKELGFNLIRLPFAGTCINAKRKDLSAQINYGNNPDLQRKTSFQVMQAVVEAAETINIKVILDYHRVGSSDTSGTSEHGLWFTQDHPMNEFLSNWEMVATAFANYTNVVGAEIFNEPHYSEAKIPEFPGPWWDLNSTDPYNFKSAVELAAAKIHAIQPNWLICIQGMYQDSWWGGNLKYAKKYPPDIAVKNKVVYTIHDYGPHVSAQPWFNESIGFPATLEPYWEDRWSFMHDEDIAPVWIGEFGSILSDNMSDPRNVVEKEWLTHLVNFIENRTLVWTWFTWSPYSRDTGGIMQDDWTVNYAKIIAVNSIKYDQFSLPPPVPPSAPPAPPLPPTPPTAPLGLILPPVPSIPPAPTTSAASSRHQLAGRLLLGLALSLSFSFSVSLSLSLSLAGL